MRDYIEAARVRGLKDFGVSDHGPAYFLPSDHALPGTQMAVSEFPNYVAEAKELQAEYAGSDITVKVGVEADFLEDQVDNLSRLLGTHPLDYSLGSVHYVNGSSVFNTARWQREDPEAVYTEYYRVARLAAGCGLFDILSHLTVIELFGPPLPEEWASRLYGPVADAIAEGGCAVEINTSGYRKSGGDEPFPNRRMLRDLIARGVPLTFGSDCHRPDQVSYGANRVAALLAELGVETALPQPFRTRRGQTLQVYHTQK